MNKKDFIKICKMSQMELKVWLNIWLAAYYEDIVREDGFLYAKGTTSVCLTAHLDTVHKSRVMDVIENKKKGIVSSPQGIGGDDRCGVYMILQILETTELRPTILFCEDEEIGGKGSQKFCKSKYIDDLKNMLFIIELDRANANDIVFYDDDNKEFHEFCKKATGYKKATGSFSDISYLCPKCGVSGVNISCGYYKAHTTDEYVVMSEMENSIDVTCKLIDEGIKNGKQFEYEEDIYSRYGYGSYDYYGLKGKGLFTTMIFYDDAGGEYLYENMESPYSCIAQLLMDNPTLCWNDIIDYEIF